MATYSIRSSSESSQPLIYDDTALYQLSGHTHGGAVRGLDRFVARANEGHVRGVYREHGLTLYVNSGTGQWAGFPTRLGVPPEITLLTLRRST